VGTNYVSRVVKFCTQVGYVKSQHTDDKSFLNGAWSESRDPLYILGLQSYLWNSLRYNRQILHTGRMYQILAYEWQPTRKRCVVRVTWLIFNFDAAITFSEGWCESREILCAGGIYQMLALGGQTTSQWARSGSRDPFSELSPQSYLWSRWNDETKHFKCCVLIHTEV